MKKIPTLFEREYENHRVVGITPKYTNPKFEYLNIKNSSFTLKIDGSCCAIIDGELYRRYDAKKGRRVPEGAIPCCDPDPVTGHWPHWVKCDKGNPSDKWFFAAMERTKSDNNLKPGAKLKDGTYEAIGEHFNGNPYDADCDVLYRHGGILVNGPETTDFDEIREYLRVTPIEGIVIWQEGYPICKIKRSDFGFSWPADGANKELSSLVASTFIAHFFNLTRCKGCPTKHSCPKFWTHRDNGYEIHK